MKSLGLITHTHTHWCVEAVQRGQVSVYLCAWPDASVFYSSLSLGHAHLNSMGFYMSFIFQKLQQKESLYWHELLSSVSRQSFHEVCPVRVCYISHTHIQTQHTIISSGNELLFWRLLRLARSFFHYPSACTRNLHFTSLTSSRTHARPRWSLDREHLQSHRYSLFWVSDTIFLSDTQERAWVMRVAARWRERRARLPYWYLLRI